MSSKNQLNRVDGVIYLSLFFLILSRYLLAAKTGISPDEAQYYMWSERLDWSYYSKGSGIAFLIRVSTLLFGADEFGVRFFAPFFSLCSSLMIYFWLRKEFKQSVAIFGVVLLNLSPIFNAGSMLMTIDSPSICLWIAAILILWQILRARKSSLIYFALLGFVIGLGFLAKYTNAFALISVGLIALIPRWRSSFSWKGIFVTLLVFGLCALPVLIWNWQNDWISLRHLLERGDLDEKLPLSLLEFFEYLLMHFIVYSPLIFLLMLGTLITALLKVLCNLSFFLKDKATVNNSTLNLEAILFLLLWSLPLLLFYFFISARSAGEANWTAPACVSLGILSAVYAEKITRLRLGKFPLGVFFLGFAMIVAILMSMILLDSSLLTRYANRIEINSNAKNNDTQVISTRRIGEFLRNFPDPSVRLRAWRQGATELEKVVRKVADKRGEALFLIADRYQIAAALYFYLPEKFRKNPKLLIQCGGEMNYDACPTVQIIGEDYTQNQFSLWPNYYKFPQELGSNPFIGKSALYVTDRNLNQTNPPQSIRRDFSSYQTVARFHLFDKNGRETRAYRIYLCHNYFPNRYEVSP